MGMGSNSQARWYYWISSEDGIDMDVGFSYKLLFNLPYTLGASSVLNIETKIRVYTSVEMPFSVDDAFTVDGLLVGIRNVNGQTPGTYSISTEAEYLPFISAKFCRDVPTPAPSARPTSFPTVSPTDWCLNLHINLVDFDETLYDFPSWFDIFGGTYKFKSVAPTFRYIYGHTVDDNLQIYYTTASEWKLFDPSGEYHLMLTTPGVTDEFYPPLDKTSTWTYWNDQGDTLTGDVVLRLTCDTTLPPTPTPTSPTEAPSLSETPCAILRVTTEEDSDNANFRYNGEYFIQNDHENYEFRSGKNQWFKNNNITEGHIF